MGFHYDFKRVSFVPKIITVLLLYWIPCGYAGVCWESMDHVTGLCRKAFSANVSREECCGIRGSAGISWTPHETSGDVFFWNFLGDGAEKCMRCHDSCSTVVCGPEKSCQMVDGVPTCQCRTTCSDGTSTRGRVCGSDRQMYKSACELKILNCQHDTNVQLSYKGKCRKSCKRVRCGDNQRCLQDQNGLPHCVQCDVHCKVDGLSEVPVCAVDGNTYNSTCALKAAVCKEGRSIPVAYSGPCVAKASCETFQCPDDLTCLTNPRNGQPVCSSCDRFCSDTVNLPVCGTDGRTYNSYCHMIVQSCSEKVFVATKKSGPCKQKRKRTKGQSKSDKDKKKLKRDRKSKRKNKKSRKRNKNRKGRRKQRKNNRKQTQNDSAHRNSPHSRMQKGTPGDTNTS